jgi:hypothetical protein
MGINLLSDDLGYRGVAGVFTVAAVLSATSWLRQRPHAPITRGSTQALLILALFLAVASAVGPERWGAPTILCAAGLVVTAVLISSDVTTSFTLLVGVGAIGSGACYLVIFLGQYFRYSTLGPNVDSAGTMEIAAFLCEGTALALYGVSALRSRNVPLGLTSMGRIVAPLVGGVGNIIFGIQMVLPVSEEDVQRYYSGYQQTYVDETLLASGTGCIIGGLALIGVALSCFCQNMTLRAVSLITGGLGVIGYGAPSLRVSRALSIPDAYGTTASLIVGGVAVILVGFSYLRDYGTLRAIATVVAGSALISYGVSGLFAVAVFGLAAIVGGTAVLGFGIMMHPQSTMEVVRARLRAIVHEPVTGVDSQVREQSIVKKLD